VSLPDFIKSMTRVMTNEAISAAAQSTDVLSDSDTG
jgi:hypothetical protein